MEGDKYSKDCVDQQKRFEPKRIYIEIRDEKLPSSDGVNLVSTNVKIKRSNICMNETKFQDLRTRFLTSHTEIFCPALQTSMDSKKIQGSTKKSKPPSKTAQKSPGETLSFRSYTRLSAHERKAFALCNIRDTFV